MRSVGQPRKAGASRKNVLLAAVAIAWSKKKRKQRGAAVGAVARPKNDGFVTRGLASALRETERRSNPVFSNSESSSGDHVSRWTR